MNTSLLLAVALAPRSGGLSWSAMPSLLAAACVGFVLADLVLLVMVGAAQVRRSYRRHEPWIVRASGMLFVGVAFQAITHAVPGLRARRT